MIVMNKNRQNGLLDLGNLRAVNLNQYLLCDNSVNFVAPKINLIVAFPNFSNYPFSIFRRLLGLFLIYINSFQKVTKK